MMNRIIAQAMTRCQLVHPHRKFAVERLMKPCAARCAAVALLQAAAICYTRSGHTSLRAA
jgi:hypothetical protein